MHNDVGPKIGPQNSISSLPRYFWFIFCPDTFTVAKRPILIAPNFGGFVGFFEMSTFVKITKNAKIIYVNHFFTEVVSP
jgi:hypothetical protein